MSITHIFPSQFSPLPHLSLFENFCTRQTVERIIHTQNYIYKDKKRYENGLWKFFQKDWQKHSLSVTLKKMAAHLRIHTTYPLDDVLMFLFDNRVSLVCWWELECSLSLQIPFPINCMVLRSHVISASVLLISPTLTEGLTNLFLKVCSIPRPRN